MCPTPKPVQRVPDAANSMAGRFVEGGNRGGDFGTGERHRRGSYGKAGNVRSATPVRWVSRGRTGQVVRRSDENNQPPLPTARPRRQGRRTVRTWILRWSGFSSPQGAETPQSAAQDAVGHVLDVGRAAVEKLRRLDGEASSGTSTAG